MYTLQYYTHARQYSTTTHARVYSTLQKGTRESFDGHKYDMGYSTRRGPCWPQEGAWPASPVFAGPNQRKGALNKKGRVLAVSPHTLLLGSGRQPLHPIKPVSRGRRDDDTNDKSTRR